MSSILSSSIDTLMVMIVEGWREMMNSIQQFGPAEKRALEFAAIKHKGQTRQGGADYINHPIAVASYLIDKGYSGDYIFTALFHDLLEDSDTTEEEILELASSMTRDAVKLMTKRKGSDIADYLDKIQENEVAFIVKIADRINNLRDGILADLDFQKKYLKETEEFYLSFAAESPFYEDLYEAFLMLQEDYSTKINKCGER